MPSGPHPTPHAHEHILLACHTPSHTHTLHIHQRAHRLHTLLGAGGYSASSVAALFSSLARVCLNALRPASADLVRAWGW